MLLAAALLLAPAARCTTSFDFDLSFPGTGSTPHPVTGKGLLTTTDLLNGHYTITNVSGTYDGVSILGLIPVNGFDGNDNLLFPNQPFIDSSGFAFTVNGKGDQGNGKGLVWHDALGGGYTNLNPNTGEGTFTIRPALTIFDFSLLFPGAGSTPQTAGSSGRLFTIDQNNGTFLVTGISGFYNGRSILGLTAPGGFHNNDNLLFGTTPFLDQDGLAFKVDGLGDDGNGNVNIWYDAIQKPQIPVTGLFRSFRRPRSPCQPCSLGVDCCCWWHS